jgi:hypothetical protein
MRSPKLWGPAFILIIIAAVFLFKKDSGDIEAPKIVENVEIDQKTESVDALKEKQIEALEAHQTLPQSKLNPKQLEAIERCQPDFIESKSLTQLVSSLVHHYSNGEGEILYNDVYHLTLPDGQARRVRIFSEREKKRLQFLSIDADGDPQVLEIPAEDQISDDPSVLKKYLSMGEVDHHEKSYAHNLLEGGEIFIQEINEDVVEFKIEMPNLYLGCNEQDCFCEIDLK